MKLSLALQSALSLALLAALSAPAQTQAPDSVPPFNPDLPPMPSPNHFGLSYRAGLNVPLTFRGLGGYAALSNARRTPGGDLYNYDNGYVLPDSSVPPGSTVPGPTSWYWGYDSASQLPGNGTIVMQRSSSEAIASSDDHYDNPMSGFELTYNREFLHKDSWQGGLEGAFGYTYMSVHDAKGLSANVTRIYDTYSFPGGVVPELPGYTGTYYGPGSLIDTAYNRNTTYIQQGASITGNRDFSADLFSIRLGPYIQIPLSQSINVGLSGGFAAMYVNTDFRFNETVTISGVGSVSHSGAGTSNGWLAGGYVAGNVSVALSDAWALVAGAQFEDLGRYTQYLKGKQASLDFTKSIFVTLGLSYSF
jgi:hypothetical protein